MGGKSVDARTERAICPNGDKLWFRNLRADTWTRVFFVFLCFSAVESVQYRTTAVRVIVELWITGRTLIYSLPKTVSLPPSIRYYCATYRIISVFGRLVMAQPRLHDRDTMESDSGGPETPRQHHGAPQKVSQHLDVLSIPAAARSHGHALSIRNI